MTPPIGSKGALTASILRNILDGLDHDVFRDTVQESLSICTYLLLSSQFAQLRSFIPALPCYREGSYRLSAEYAAELSDLRSEIEDPKVAPKVAVDPALGSV